MTKGIRTINCILKDGRVLSKRAIYNIKKRDLLSALEDHIHEDKCMKFKMALLGHMKLEEIMAKLIIFRQERKYKFIWRENFVILIENTKK